MITLLICSLLWLVWTVIVFIEEPLKQPRGAYKMKRRKFITYGIDMPFPIIEYKEVYDLKL